MRFPIFNRIALGIALAASALTALPAEAGRKHDRYDQRYDHRYEHRDWNDRDYRHGYRDGRRDERRWDRYDDRRDWRRDQRGRVVYREVYREPDYRYERLYVHPGRGYGPPRWARGHRIHDYRYAPTYVVVDYNRYGLRHPPRGYHWRRDDRGDWLLVAIASGIIADVIFNN